MKVFIIDAFTEQPFKGNPAGVCLLEKEISVETMQSIATELNLSETAFLRQSSRDHTHYSIRYFTPTVEIAFCGHATLASSKLVLHNLGKNRVDFITFHGLKLSAVSEGESIKMKFPLYETVDYIPNQTLYEAFGITDVKASKFAVSLDMLIIEVADKETLLSLQPDFMKAIGTSDTIKELVVTARSENHEYDFYSRCFCPWIGINEDPVTGASHTVLAKYWGDILGKTEMRAYQCSQRGGFMNLKVISDSELEVVSKAVIVFEGIVHL